MDEICRQLLINGGSLPINEVAAEFIKFISINKEKFRGESRPIYHQNSTQIRPNLQSKLGQNPTKKFDPFGDRNSTKIQLKSNQNSTKI